MTVATPAGRAGAEAGSCIACSREVKAVAGRASGSGHLSERPVARGGLDEATPEYYGDSYLY